MHVRALRLACLALGASALVGQTPSLATYKSGLAGQIAVIRAQIAGLPQPKINTSAHHLLANTNWVDAGQGTCSPASNCTFDNVAAMNAYTDALARAGVSSIEINIDVAPLSAATQYTGSLPSDCPSGWNCSTLANYDSLIAHAASKGLAVRLLPTPSPALKAACGLTATSTEANLESCFKPLYVAAAARWPSLDSFTVFHEAVGIWGNCLPMPLTLTMVRTFIVNCAAAIRAQQPSIKIGAGADTMYSGDLNYYNDWIANAASSLDFFGVDLYPSVWDVTQYVSTALAEAAGMAASAKGIGKAVRLNESARPPWVPQGLSPTESNAYEGAGDIEWLKDGLDDTWADAILHWAAAHGFSSMAIFPSPLLIWYTSDMSNDNTSTGNYMLNLLAYLSQTTFTGFEYARMGKWFGASIQGHVGLKATQTALIGKASAKPRY